MQKPLGSVKKFLTFEEFEAEAHPIAGTLSGISTTSQMGLSNGKAAGQPTITGEFPRSGAELVAITSDFCPHCKALQPALDSLKGRIKLRQIRTGVDNQPSYFFKDVGYAGYVPYLAFVRYSPSGEVAFASSYRGSRDEQSIYDFYQWKIRELA